MTTQGNAGNRSLRAPVDVGTLVGGAERFRGEVGEVVNPGRLDEIVGSFRVATHDVVHEAVLAAAQAQKGWAATPYEQRNELLGRAADAIVAGAETLGRVLAAEAGIPVAQAQREAVGAAQAFRNAADFSAEVLAARFVPGGSAGEWIRVQRRALGVVACIVPWNAPLGLAAQKLGPALTAGNAVVLKPSPLAPLAVTLMASMIAGHLPPGAIGVVNGGMEAGDALVAHPMVRKISFTGGGSTAKSIMRSAAATLTPVHFELGGNDAAIVLDDADLVTTAQRIAAAAFRRAGQICYAVKRVYVPEGIADQFGEHLEAAVDEIAVGDALDARTTMGPVHNRAQFSFISDLTERAASKGRDIRILGEVLDSRGWDNGYFLRPALVMNAEPNDEIVTVEQFGPILPLVRYRHEDEAVSFANDSEYGLGSSIWSADPDRAVAVAERIQAGVTFINNHVLSPSAMKNVPFGGVKQSGIGWENSAAGLEEYLQFHSVDVHSPVDNSKG